MSRLNRHCNIFLFCLTVNSYNSFVKNYPILYLYFLQGNKKYTKLLLQANVQYSVYIPCITRKGLRSVGARLLIWNIFCTFQIIRFKLHGSTTLDSPLGKICLSASLSLDNCSHSFSNSEMTSPDPNSSLRISSVKIRRKCLQTVLIMNTDSHNTQFTNQRCVRILDGAIFQLVFKT